jgi:phenylalanyl-tRNA synthetase beta chain
MSTLRPSLLAGIIPSVAHNVNHGQATIRLFEFGNVFLENQAKDNLIPGYAEHTSFVAITSGKRNLRAFDVADLDADYHDLKGTIETVLEDIGLVCAITGDPGCDVVDFGETISCDAQALGIVGKLSAKLCARFDLNRDVYFAELHWERIIDLATAKLNRRYRPASRYPVVDRDLAVVVDEHRAAGDLLSAIRSASTDLLQNADIFDVYRGKGISQEKKSIAFGLRFGADRTLKDEEVDREIEAIVGTLEKRFGAQLRS